MSTLSVLGSAPRTWIARQRIAGLFGLLLLIAPGAAEAQPTAGIISPSRATAWSGAGVTGGIPNRTTICATLNPGATAVQINLAIAACPSGQVVFLTAGTYDLATGISFGIKSNVTLRGAGADQTFLKFSGGTFDCAGVESPICIGSAYANNQFPENSTLWTAGYEVGTTVITVASTLGMEVGDILVLDQLDDIVDGGEVFVCSNLSCTAEGGNSAGRVDRSQQQLVKVVALAGNQVTITPGLRMPNWRSSQSPGVFWNDLAPVLVGNGVESLSLEAPPSLNGIIFMHVSDSWAKGVRVINPARNHVWLYQSMRITVRDSYFYGGQSAESTSYGIEDFSTGDNLVENNIFQHVTAPLSHNGSNTGSVFGYNFAIDDNYTASPGWMIPNILYHEAGMSHLLHEGNDGLGAWHDDIHGTTHFQTLFRNHLYGDIWNDPPKDTNTQVMHIQSYGRFFNIVGNVLGRTGYYDTYQADSSTAIYTLGDSPSPPENPVVPEDPNVEATMLRWGNYDTVTGDTRFLVSEVPTSSSPFANEVPATQTLPPSFYLAARPSWFGATPWPAIGPDVTGGQHTDGHAYKIPARACWEQTAIDPSYGSANVRLFDPDACYGQGVGNGHCNGHGNGHGAHAPKSQGGNHGGNHGGCEDHGAHAPKSPPAHLKATVGKGRVELAWRPVPRASEYRIFRATNGVWDPMPVATVRRDTYTDRGLTNGTVYSYKVAAVNRSGMGPLSRQVDARPMAPPSGLSAVAGNRQVTLSWQASAGASTYSVYRSKSADGHFIRVASNVTGLTFTDTGLTNGRKYYYRVRAFAPEGMSGLSARVSATPVPPPPSSAPAHLTATPGNGRVGLTWDDVAGATSYRIFRDGASIARVETTMFMDTGLTNGRKYTYRIAASNAGGDGPSSVVSATPQAPPPPDKCDGYDRRSSGHGGKDSSKDKCR